MTGANGSSKRRQATVQFAQAQQALRKGRIKRAIALAQDSLAIDKTYTEVRHWLAQRYLETGELRLASHEYQNILRTDHGDEQAWTALEQIDADTAVRLKRLCELAPDPFVSYQRREGAVGDFDALGELAPAADETITEGGTPFLRRGELSAEMISLDEIESEEEAEPEAPEAMPWEFEQDREYWQQWLARRLVRTLVPQVAAAWTDEEVLVPVFARCIRAHEHTHPQLFSATRAAAQRLQTASSELYLIPENHMQLVLLKLQPPTLGVTTGMLRTLSEEEMAFVVGRHLGWLASGYLAALQVVNILLARPERMPGDVADILREVLAEACREQAFELGIEPSARLKSLGHAWQQRAELSADRAGLLACRNINAATSTIAKSTGRNAQEASRVSAEQFMAQFKEQTPQQLAAIPVQDNPSSSAPYAAYRMRMLRWWASTDAYRRELCVQLGNV